MVQGLSAASVLEVWERGVNWHPLDRAMLILRHACPEMTDDRLWQLPIGQRDALLIHTRRRMFGDAMEASAACPECDERLEWVMSCQELVEGCDRERSWTATCVCDGMAFQLRCPDSRDLAKVVTLQDMDEALLTLLEQCMTDNVVPDRSIRELPESVKGELIASLKELDPYAEILITIACPSCGHAWRESFDIVSFLWAELQVKAKRLLQDIDVLARTYGWNEDEILRLSNVRRAVYREMALS